MTTRYVNLPPLPPEEFREAMHRLATECLAAIGPEPLVPEREKPVFVWHGPWCVCEDCFGKPIIRCEKSDTETEKSLDSSAKVNETYPA